MTDNLESFRFGDLAGAFSKKNSELVTSRRTSDRYLWLVIKFKLLSENWNFRNLYWPTIS